jgi:CRP-like cAMP-binding protein
MIIKQADLFWGMDQDFIRSLMDVSTKESHEKGDILFNEGNPANRFYVMLRGRVEVDIGDDHLITYSVNHAGEAFGWSGLLERERYASSGTCLEHTTLLSFDVKDIQRLCEDNPVNGMMLYKKLAGLLGDRLIANYHMDDLRLHEETGKSYGSGQMVMSDAL